MVTTDRTKPTIKSYHMGVPEDPALVSGNRGRVVQLNCQVVIITRGRVRTERFYI